MSNLAPPLSKEILAVLCNFKGNGMIPDPHGAKLKGMNSKILNLLHISVVAEKLLYSIVTSINLKLTKVIQDNPIGTSGFPFKIKPTILET